MSQRFSAPGQGAAGDIEMGMVQQAPAPQQKSNCCFIVLVIIAVVLVILIVLGLIYKDDIVDWFDGDDELDSTDVSGEAKGASHGSGDSGDDSYESEGCLSSLTSYLPEDMTWKGYLGYGTLAVGAYTGFAYFTYATLGLPNPINGFALPCYLIIPLILCPLYLGLDNVLGFYATDSRSKRANYMKRKFGKLESGEAGARATLGNKYDTNRGWWGRWGKKRKKTLRGAANDWKVRRAEAKRQKMGAKCGACNHIGRQYKSKLGRSSRTRIANKRVENWRKLYAGGIL